MKKICFLATIPYSIRVFLSDPIRRLSSDFEVTIVSNLEERASDLEHLSGVQLIHVPFARKPSPWVDLKCFFQLVKLFRAERFDSIHSITPKAGLLSMTAGWIARVPIRLHTFTGQVWATKMGLSRVLFRAIDRFFEKKKKSRRKSKRPVFLTHIQADIEEIVTDYSRKGIGSHLAFSPTETEFVVERLTAIMNRLEKVSGNAKVPASKAAEKLHEILEKSIAEMSQEDKKNMGDVEPQINAQIKRVINPWFRFFLTYDPKTALKKVKCPVLAINGEKDLQVPPKKI